MDLEENIDSSIVDGQEQSKLENLAKEDISSVVEKYNIEKSAEQEQQSKVFDLPENGIDRKLYEEILEKLDIKKRDNSNKNNENFSQKNNIDALLKDIKKIEQSKAQKQVKDVIVNDFSKIQKLVKSGLINSEQGQNLKKQVLKKAFDKLVQTEKTKRSMNTNSTASMNAKVTNTNNALEEFSKNNPDFFSSNGRKEVLGYLKSFSSGLGTDELTRISEIVRVVEQSAIDRYLQKEAHETTLRNSNESAKQRLTANAQKSNAGSNLSRSFTREQIGKMSGSDFAKYETAIMDALKKGLIK